MVSLKHFNILGTRWTDKINESKIMSSLVNGIFYLLLSSIRKVIPRRESSSDNVVVVSLHRLGDSVFTIPALKQIKNAYPEQIIILCFKETKPIYNLIFDESELLVVERKQFKLNGRYATKKIRSLVSELDPEMILDLNGDMASASLLYLLGVKEIYGLCRPQFRAIYKKCITVRKVPHIIDIYLDAISTIIQIENRNDIYEFPSEINKQAKILIHPSAGWSAKEWGLTKFLELGEKLSKTFSMLDIPCSISVSSPNRCLHEKSQSHPTRAHKVRHSARFDSLCGARDSADVLHNPRRPTVDRFRSQWVRWEEALSSLG